MTGSGAAGDYATPYAFGKKGNEKAKGKKQASLTGYTVVNESESTKVPYIKLSSIAPNIKVAGKENEKKAAEVSGMEVAPKSSNKEKDVKGKTNPKTAETVGMEIVKQKETQAGEKSPKPNSKGDKGKDKKMAKVSGMEMVKDLHENRWLDLKREAASPSQKINRGISNINKQLAEALLATDTYKTDAGGVSQETFIKHVYKNVNGTDATLSEVTDLISWMTTNHLSQADVLVAASQLTAFQTTIGLTGLATTGIEYTPYTA